MDWSNGLLLTSRSNYLLFYFYIFIVIVVSRNRETQKEESEAKTIFAKTLEILSSFHVEKRNKKSK